MGGGETFEGMIDLITQKAIYFDGDDGEKVRDDEVPAEYAAEVKKYRHHMLEALAMYSDELMEMLLSEEEPTRRADSQSHQAGRAGSRALRPCSSARPIRTRACSRCSTRSSAICPRRWSARSRPRSGTIPTQTIHARARSRPSRSSAWRSRSSKIRSASSRSCASIRARSTRARCSTTSAPAARTASAAS